ncbi:PEP-CTERM sorting domain-containing protein [Deferrisoma palaeochoriense]
MKPGTVWMMVAVAALVAGVVPARAVAITIDFDDRGTSLQDLGGSYAGFSWDGGWKTSEWDGEICARGISGASMDYQGPLGFTLDAFSFKVRFAANQAQNLTVTAFDTLGVQIGVPETVSISESWQEFTFDWGGAVIDKLVFTADAGNNNSRFFMDNFTYTPVPEPGTLILLGTGFAGLAGYRRRKGPKAA